MTAGLFRLSTRYNSHYSEHTQTQVKSALSALESWRRGWESNPRIKVLQTSPLPLGYRAANF